MILTKEYAEITKMVDKLINEDLTPVMQKSVADTIEKKLSELEDKYLQTEMLYNHYKEENKELAMDRYDLAIALASITEYECCQYNFENECDLAEKIINENGYNNDIIE